MPFFQEGLAYARANMYKSDAAMESLLHGEAAVEGNAVKVTFCADEAINAYLYAAPASSYTKNAVPALNVQLMLEFTQDGTPECLAQEITLTADALAHEVTFELPEKVSGDVILKAAVLDRAVSLCTLESGAK